MRLYFYVFAFSIISDALDIIRKETKKSRKSFFLFFAGGWLICYAYFFLRYMEVEKIGHWIGIAIYLFIVFLYWRVICHKECRNN